MVHATTVEVLIAVFRVTTRHNSPPELSILIWEQSPGDLQGLWSLPCGVLRDNEDLQASASRQLAEKVDLKTLSHLEQLAIFSDPGRRPYGRVLGCAFVGLVPQNIEPLIPPDTHWKTLNKLPPMVADHAAIIKRARSRLAGKLGYSNLGFALSPAEFTLSELAEIYQAALGYQVDSTNLKRVLTRRKVIEPTGTGRPSGPDGGRPAALFRFCDNTLRITDQAAVLRKPQ